MVKVAKKATICRYKIEQGGLLRDNIYGTIEEDVWRRDFTVNALYYRLKDFAVIDYVGGIADLEAGTIKLIGDWKHGFVRSGAHVKSRPFCG